MSKSIIGKRVILFDFQAEDLADFVDLHREDKKAMMGIYCLEKMTQEEGIAYITNMVMSGMMKIWTVYVKNGKASKKIGFLYIDNITPISCSIVGNFYKEIILGLPKLFKQKKYSWIEDSVRCLCQHIFDNGINRIEWTLFTSNKLSEKLAVKCGFKYEGIKRQCFKVGEELRDMIYYSLLKTDIQQEKIDVGSN